MYLPPSQYKKVKYPVLLILPILHDKLVALRIISIIDTTLWENNIEINTNFNPQYTIRAEETTLFNSASRQSQNNEREDTTVIQVKEDMIIW
jgi:hypothetical protein